MGKSRVRNTGDGGVGGMGGMGGGDWGDGGVETVLSWFFCGSF